MKILSIIVFLISTISTQVLASGCSEMAAFNTKVKDYMETANLSNEIKDKINTLSSDCKNLHDMGMDVENINSCKEVLEIIKVY